MNSFITVIAVAAGGFIGSIARFAVNRAIAATVRSAFPYSTLLVNVSGSFLLGMLAGSLMKGTISLFLGAGVLGSFTTFSTFNTELLKLIQSSKWKSAVWYIGLSYGGGIAVALSGMVAGMRLFAAF